MFLNVERLEAHPEYQTWTVTEGRVKLLEDLLLLLRPILG
jgi:hypothetical protein